MDQHPIPRNITGFQFQLVGFMTLKQFSYLIVGLIFAFIFYKAPLSIFKIPLSALSLFLGVAFAFLPIQERPLEVWVRNFLRSIYSPTEYIYQKETVRLPYLEETTAQNQLKLQKSSAVLETHHDAKQKLEAYLKNASFGKRNPLDAYEEDFLKKLSPLFNQRQLFPQTSKNSAAAVIVRPVNALPKGIIAGLVKSDKEALAGILINIQKQNGEVARILKTDSSGKFKSNLPLPAGVYEVKVEDLSKRYKFKAYQFKVNGEILTPWLIKNIL
ncbi:MAG: hypothetical protein UU21_C0026G0006 [Candidatus Levybacteria bacterium GW2011_GWA2_40_8]|nr:MAG: hypothetical protein UU21_C0026G0006 [Candidatus Levybacteria bacterium GW2011_GWA2_40_8]